MKKLRGLSLLLIFMGIPLTIYSCKMRGDTAALLERGVKAQARVLAKTHQPSANKGTNYYADLSFEAGGKKIQKRLRVYEGRYWEMDVNSLVDIIYDPENPETVQLGHKIRSSGLEIYDNLYHAGMVVTLLSMIVLMLGLKKENAA